MKCKIARTDDADLRADTDAANTYLSYFINNALHSLF